MTSPAPGDLKADPGGRILLICGTTFLIARVMLVAGLLAR